MDSCFRPQAGPTRGVSQPPLRVRGPHPAPEILAGSKASSLLQGSELDWTTRRTKRTAGLATEQIRRWPASRRDRVRPVRRARFFLFGIGALCILSALFWAALFTQNRVKERGEFGYSSLEKAVEALQTRRFEDARRNFEEARLAFTQGTDFLGWWGGSLIDVSRFIPGLSQLASGRQALVAGKYFATAGIPLTAVAEEVAWSGTAYQSNNRVSLLDFFNRIRGPLQTSLPDLEAGQQALDNIRLEDLPEDKRGTFLRVRQTLPALIALFGKFERERRILEEILGGNGPRKYLFLLQNNQEMRATGGFIGSYALLDVNDGVVRQFFVDGIFNPDGQLKENIVPPQPLQKVSAGWSLHDSNWFPDFPTSAEKAIFFYEKTGGPTVDGVIALTPRVMEKLLAVTGPIELPEYGLTVDANNFMPVIQEQVEVKYDKEENQPKKVLADLSVLLLDKVFASQDKATLYRVAEALIAGLNEKQLLLYMRHAQTQALIDAAGWSGRMLAAPQDYLAVINTNINGYKTDGVIDETIRHQAEIAADGSLVDTVTITRTHRGGQTPYEWWNKVNADYMRVYVPQGAELLSARGLTREFTEPPLDYDSLGFRRDADVEREERNMTIDEGSGTRIYQEGDKTVFAGWAYVSPQESVTVEYRYRLPFKLDAAAIRAGTADAYSILYQKQSGSPGSQLVSSVIFPEEWQPIWQSQGNLLPYGREWKLETTLATDVFAGMVFGMRRDK